jgi:AraC-like DNA-binding protein
MPLGERFHTRYGKREFDVACGAALFRPADELHDDRYETPIRCVTIVVNLTEWSSPARTVPFVAKCDFAGAAAAISAELDQADGVAGLVLDGVAAEVLCSLVGRRPLRDRGKPRWVRGVRERLDEELLGDVSLRALGLQVGREACYVAAGFKSVYGISIGEYVRNRRLSHARALLCEDISLSEVALRCGFSDQSHFTRRFRRAFGVTPQQYRRRRAV